MLWDSGSYLHLWRTVRYLFHHPYDLVEFKPQFQTAFCSFYVDSMLHCYSDQSHICTIQWPCWDLAVIYPMVQLSKPMRCWLGSKIYLHSSWDSKFANTLTGLLPQASPLFSPWYIPVLWSENWGFISSLCNIVTIICPYPRRKSGRTETDKLVAGFPSPSWDHSSSCLRRTLSS